MAARMLTTRDVTVTRDAEESAEMKTAFCGKAAMGLEMDTKTYFNDFLREAEAFRRQLPELLERFPHEFVAIYNGQVIDHGRDWDELAKKAHDLVPDKFVLLEKVVPRSTQIVHIDGVGA